MNNTNKKQNMGNLTSVLKETIVCINDRPPPLHPPILIRRNATWDDDSRRIEEERVRQVLKQMGVLHLLD